ncbi:MAG: hypothetical protein KAS12_03395 [Candidatus Aenigmarchaeota archaeon]|nr:hypothetical protein [Candidatus Aenigmarchaeota archaeon]
MIIDLSFIELWCGHSIIWLVWQILKIVIGILIAYLIIYFYLKKNKSKKKKEYFSKIEYDLLAIDIPDSEQGPKGAEQIFAQLASLKEKDFRQLDISLEIIGIDGHIQFLVRTPHLYRDIVESALYAQYPQAGISEVDDYSQIEYLSFPNEQYTLWGSELTLYANEAYPIRTYPDFEDKLAREFKDPLSGLLELLSTLRTSEQFWIQILLRPASSNWQAKGKQLVKDLTAPSEEGKAQRLTLGDARVVEAIQHKISKIGFAVTIRLIYFAKKEIFSKSRIIGVLGAFNQFNTLDMNGFKPFKKSKTRTGLIFPQRCLSRRQNEILNNYQQRKSKSITPWFVLNIEELATIYHFPVISVKAPGIKKTVSKQAEPPFGLPVNE